MFLGCLFTVLLSIWPFLSLITLSATSAIKALCVTIITVFSPLFASHCFLSNFNTSTPVFESSAPVGSSHKSNLGFLAIALAIDTLCCPPPDNWLGNLFKWFSSPTSLSIFLADLGFFTISFTISTFSKTVNVGSIL